MKNFFYFVTVVFVVVSGLFSQIKPLDRLIFENLIISMPCDSLVTPNKLHIIDQRKFKPNTLGITQINKYKYIPIDQYLVLNHEVADFLSYKIEADSVKLDHQLVVENLTLWEDNKPVFNRAKVLNGYSFLLDENNQKIKNWMWDIRIKNNQKLEIEENIAHLFDHWLNAQRDSLNFLNFNTPIYPYRFRRVLESWFDFVVLPDGFLIDGNLTLDFPRNHKNNWFLGSAGMYYRKFSYHESFSIGGFDQHWYKRISAALIWRNNTTLRIGVNSFNHDRFDHVDYWNIIMVNLGLSSSLEYRPKFFRGLFLGGGLYMNVNGLPYIPDKIKIVEPGLFITLGVCLP
ncbi:MAG: hypothetical protein JXQ65_13500 [Candidatus Marinimicrobia bacterium]|nr:hypothetical protein [Candidatus Neomarinimicrobiota bacterium]